jgi:drug/metabolite transporter (DMT)-like permease
MNLKSKNFIYIGLTLSILLTQYASPIDLAIIRFLLTSITLLIILVFLRQKLFIQRKGIPYLIISSILMSVYTWLFLSGVKVGAPGAGGILVTTITPIMTYVLVIVLAKRRPTHHEIFGLLLGCTAAFFLLHLWTNIASILISGNLFFVVSCFTWVILSRITAKANDYGSALTFTLWMYIFCFLFLLPFTSFASLLQCVQIKELKFWVNFIYSASINTGLATTFYFFATSKLGPAKSSSFLYIVPFAAAFFSWLILDETFHWNTILGGVIGLLAVYILNSKKK